MKSLSILLGLLVGLVIGCHQRSTRCEQIADEVRGMLQDCGVTFENYDDELGDQCTERLEAVYECYLTCYQNASCEAVFGSDYTDNKLLHDCTIDCVQANP